MSLLSYHLSQEKEFLIVTFDEGKRRLLYQETLLEMARGDRQLVEFLIEGELDLLGVGIKSPRAQTLALNRVRVKKNRVESALKKLGATGRLFWKGKKVIVDPFSKVDFYFEATLQEGIVLVRGNGLEFCEGFLPGEPPWLIQNGTLKKLSENIDVKWIEKVYPEPWKVEDSALLKKLEEGDFAHAPRLVSKNRAEASAFEPLPFLKLTDRSGAFANLWMDYGPLGKKQASEKSWERDLLETGFIKKQVGEAHYFCPLDKVDEALRFLLEIGWKIFDAQGRRVLRQVAEAVTLSTDEMKLGGTVTYEGQTIDFEQVLQKSHQGQRFIDLGAEFVGLIEKKREWIDLEGRVKFKPEEIGIVESFNSQVVPFEERAPDSSFKGTLFPYQQQGVNWLAWLYASKFHGLLADEMGLGKTVQLLAFLSQTQTSLPHLVVMPTSLLFNWKKEFEKFLPESEVYIHAGLNRESNLHEKKIILTSYAILRQDIELFKKISFEALILDEAQNIKNPESLTATCACQLKGNWRLAITGTPIENRWEDLWSLFHFIMPKLWEDKRALSAQIKKKLRPFILRRKKEEVGLQLPPKYEQIVWVDMSEQQQLLYDTFLTSARKKKDQMEVLEAILRLRQICCHPELIDENAESAKLERLLLDLESVVLEGKKAIVFSSFTKMLHLIEKELKERQWNYLLLEGSTQDRQTLVDRFQNDPDTPLFLISLKAGGVGLNLTAADFVFLYDPWWNEAVENQAIDRAHRIGKESSLIARRYVTIGSVEEKMMRLKEHKKGLSSELFDFNSEITFEELTQLLN